MVLVVVRNERSVPSSRRLMVLPTVHRVQAPRLPVPMSAARATKRPPRRKV